MGSPAQSRLHRGQVGLEAVKPRTARLLTTVLRMIDMTEDPVLPFLTCATRGAKPALSCDLHPHPALEVTPCPKLLNSNFPAPVEPLASPAPVSRPGGPPIASVLQPAPSAQQPALHEALKRGRCPAQARWRGPWSGGFAGGTGRGCSTDGRVPNDPQSPWSAGTELTIAL